MEFAVFVRSLSADVADSADEGKYFLEELLALFGLSASSAPSAEEKFRS
jgi:hypothetical protein